MKKVFAVILLVIAVYLVVKSTNSMIGGSSTQSKSNGIRIPLFNITVDVKPAK